MRGVTRSFAFTLVAIMLKACDGPVPGGARPLP